MFRYSLVCMSIIVSLIGCSDVSKKTDNQMEEKTTITNNEMYMLVGTYTSGESKGIYIYKLDTVTGTSKYVSEIEVDNPSYLVLDKDERFVYAVTEDEGIETSAANAFSFNKKEGKLAFLNKQLTKGGAPCYINIDKSGKHVVTANYLGASITAFWVNEDGSLGETTQVVSFTGNGAHKERQKQPHLHCVVYSPDGNYLYGNDLGTDNIHKLNVNPDSEEYLSAGKPSEFSVKAGSGPRHIEFHPNAKYAYLITEISGEVLGYRYEDGNLTHFQSIKADTLNAQGSADIHISPDGKFLYASNRLEGDGIAIFSINEADGVLTKVGYQETEKHPRNFAITPNGKFLLVASRDGDVIQIFERNPDTGLLENTSHDITLDMPVCIKFASLE